MSYCTSANAEFQVDNTSGVSTHNDFISFVFPFNAMIGTQIDSLKAKYVFAWHLNTSFL